MSGSSGQVLRVGSLDDQPHIDHLINPNIKEKKDPVLQLFYEKGLLIRAMESDEIFDDMEETHRCKLGSFGREITYMQSEKGLMHASSTLIVPGKNVILYRELGFLFDGQESNLEHIYGIDSNSATNSSGELIAGKNSEFLFSSLDELSEAIEKGDLLNVSRLNEVNATFRIKNLLGLVARCAKDSRADALLNLKIRSVQKLIKKQDNIDLPIYKYDEEKGTLFALSAELIDIQREIINSSPSKATVKNFRTILNELLLDRQK